MPLKSQAILNHIIKSTVGTAQETTQWVPQVDGIVTACADHTTCLGVCRAHVGIPAEIIDQLLATDSHCRRLCPI